MSDLPFTKWKKIALKPIIKNCFNTYPQEDQAQDDKKIKFRSHRQPEFWDLLMPDFATLKVPVTDPNSLLRCDTDPEVDLAQGDITALTATTADGQQT